MKEPKLGNTMFGNCQLKISTLVQQNHKCDVVSENISYKFFFIKTQ